MQIFVRRALLPEFQRDKQNLLIPTTYYPYFLIITKVVMNKNRQFIQIT